MVLYILVGLRPFVTRSFTPALYAGHHGDLAIFLFRLPQVVGRFKRAPIYTPVRSFDLIAHAMLLRDPVQSSQLGPSQFPVACMNPGAHQQHAHASAPVLRLTDEGHRGNRITVCSRCTRPFL